MLGNELRELNFKMTGVYGGRLVKEFDQIEDHITRCTLFGNLVLKPVWNQIKRGERTHQVAIGVAVLLAAVGMILLFAPTSWFTYLD